MLVHLPREEGYRHKHTPKNGPALAGYGAITMKDALRDKMTTLPEAAPPILDLGQRQGALSSTLHSKWRPASLSTSPTLEVLGRRGTNENTNGLLRQYFPKGTDLSRWNAEEIDTVAAHPQRPSAQDP